MIRNVLLVALTILILVMAWVLLSAWVCKAAWLTYLWANVSYMLHQEWFVVPLVTVIYITAFLFARWHLIALPTRLVLHQQIGDMRLRLNIEPTDGDPEKQRKIDQLQEMLNRTAARLKTSGPLDRILWQRGQELANRRHVSEVERELSIIQSDARVKARLETAEQELREIPTKNASVLADLIQKELTPAVDAARIRCLLYEALGTIYSSRDDDNDNLLTWHNKTLWLTGLGLLLLISLEGVRRGGGGLFVVGATGGFMSRLMRTLKRNNVPTDYGAYWTTLFLSPLVGALAGWTGILLIEVSHKLAILGAVFDGVTLQNGNGNFALGLGFLLGFSERLFDEILKPLEARIEQKVQASSSSSSPSSSSFSVAPVTSSSSPRSSSPSSSSSSSVSSRNGASTSGASSSSNGLPSSSSSLPSSSSGLPSLSSSSSSSSSSGSI
jgi:hypothetical protein